jgi:hypothetical protein
MPPADVVDHARDHAVGWDERHRDVEQRSDVGLAKRLRLQRRDDLRGEHRLPVVADARRAPGKVGGQLRIAGRDHRPAVDEDLRADLLREHLAAVLGRAGLRRAHAFLEPQEHGVLRGETAPTPPERRPVLDDVVEPGLPDLGRRELQRVAVVRQRAQERQRAGDVVIGLHERAAPLLRGDLGASVDVVVDLPELRLDALVRPPLERTAEVDADDLAQDAGVDPLRVAGREDQGDHPPAS